MTAPTLVQEEAAADAEVLLFGAALRAAVEGGARSAAPAPRSRPARAAQLVERISYSGGYRLRGRWLSDDYTQLRNAAWAVRNTRVGTEFNPLALKLVLAEAERLVAQGEPLVYVLEAFAELLTKP